MAAYTAVHRPDVFGKAGGYSFYLPEPGRTLLLDAIEESSGEGKPRIWVVWNENELHRAEWNLDLARDSQQVAEALQDKGYTVVTREVKDSAGWGSWRVRAAEVLAQMFPR